MNQSAKYALASLRLSIGLTFFWACLDKAFGLIYGTPREMSWLNGGSPTQWYLSSSFGPLAEFFKAIAGNGFIDVLYMLGIFMIGLSLTLGIATRLGGWAGMVMVLLMYASHPAPWLEPKGFNPLIDIHIIEATALALLALTPCGDTLGLGNWWRKKVPNYNWLH